MDVYSRFARAHVTVPTLLLLAGRDCVIDNAATRRYASRFAGPVQTIEYPDAHHTLEFEAAGPPFHEDLSRWLAGLHNSQ